MKKAITFIVIMFLFSIRVSAASSCTYQEQSELNSKAANVKISYEAVENKVVTGEEYYIDRYIKVTIANVTEDLYVKIKNDYNSDQLTYNSSDAKDDIITFNWKNIDEVTNFTLQVYTSINTKCPNERLKTIYLTTPRYNEFSRREICVEQPDFYLCQTFVTFAPIDDTKFTNQITKYLNDEVDNKGEVKEEPQDKTITDVIFNFINTYKWYIIIVILVGTIVGVGIYNVKTKKQRELGL